MRPVMCVRNFMRRHLLSVTAIVLIPGLLLDPLTASAFMTRALAPAASIESSLFQQEAFINRAVYQLHPYSSRIRVQWIEWIRLFSFDPFIPIPLTAYGGAVGSQEQWQAGLHHKMENKRSFPRPLLSVSIKPAPEEILINRRPSREVAAELQDTNNQHADTWLKLLAMGRRFALSIRIPFDDVDDIIQEAALRLWQQFKKPGFVLETNLIAYFNSISKNAYLHMRRKTSRNVELTATLVEERTSLIDQTVMALDIQAALATLQKTNRRAAELLKLRHMDEQDIADLAAQYSTSEAVMRVQLTRARQKMYELLTNVPEPPTKSIWRSKDRRPTDTTRTLGFSGANGHYGGMAILGVALGLVVARYNVLWLVGQFALASILVSLTMAIVVRALDSFRHSRLSRALIISAS
jgi:RNA polymerase sigma factor (sigma-70 family)